MKNPPKTPHPFLKWLYNVTRNVDAFLKRKSLKILLDGFKLLGYICPGKATEIAQLIGIILALIGDVCGHIHEKLELKHPEFKT